MMKTMNSTRRQFLGGVAAAAVLPLGLKWPVVQKEKEDLTIVWGPALDIYDEIWGLPMYDLRVWIDEPADTRTLMNAPTGWGYDVGLLKVKATHRYVSDCFNTDQMQEAKYYWECRFWGYETLEKAQDVQKSLACMPRYFGKKLSSWEVAMGSRFDDKTLKMVPSGHVPGIYVVPYQGWELEFRQLTEGWYKQGTQLHKEALDEYAAYRNK